MEELPDPIKHTFIVSIIIMFILTIFIILVILLYNKKQLFYQKEKQLKEAEYQNQLLQKELERQKAIQAERERISHDMHDDLGAGISALKLQTEFLQQKLNNRPELQQDVEELLKTSAEMNLSMRQMLWNLNKANDTVQNLMQYISTYGENFFGKTNIKFRWQHKSSAQDLPISSDFRWHIFLCAKEAFNNIYKHSSAENVIFRFRQIDHQIVIEIEDDGVGIKNFSKLGNGSLNMKHRMQECGGTFEIVPSKKGLHLKFQTTL